MAEKAADKAERLDREDAIEREVGIVDRDYYAAREVGPGNSPAFASGPIPEATDWFSSDQGMPTHVAQALSELEAAEDSGSESSARAATKRLEAAGLTPKQAAAARKAYAEKRAKTEEQAEDTGKREPSPDPTGVSPANQPPAERKSPAAAKGSRT